MGSSFRSSLNSSNEAAILQDTKLPHRIEQVQFVSRDWTPDQIELTCALPGCPKALGNIFFAEPPVDGKIKLHRCSAFLISTDEIMTNGHCDYSATATGYFVTRTDIAERTWRKISARTFLRYTQAPDDPERKVETMNPDVAAFKLEKEILGIAALALGRAQAVEYKQLIGYVFDSSGENIYAARKIQCTVRPHARDFPFAIWESPTLIQAFDCSTQEGNSGSPLFAKEGGEVEAVLQGFRAPDEASVDAFNKHWSALATNARCLDIAGPPARPCAVVTPDEISRRWSQYYKEVIAEVRSRAPMNAATLGFGYDNYVYELATDAAKPARDFQIYYLPKCRVADAVSSPVPMPVEIVELRFSEWADAVVTPTLLVSPGASVLQAYDTGIHFDLGVSWPDSGRQLLPAKDADGKEVQPLPMQYPDKLTVELEKCPG